MIADLKPYPRYRAAEGEWLGKIPSHWTIRRMKYVVRETDSRSKTGKEQLLRVSQYTGVTQRRSEENFEEPDTRADSLVGYKRVEPNDLVINIMLAWNGSLGVSPYAGITSPAYCVYRFGRKVHPWYFHSLLRSPAYKARIKALSTGVVESRLRLYSDDLGRIEGLVPPADEQVAIVRFLDWANGRLERAIWVKRKAIALLNEQKQAIIHRAVTRGLDPSVPLKPSGIRWRGDIPQHWEVATLRRHWRVTDCKHLTVPFVDEGMPLASVVEVQPFLLDLSRCKRTRPEWYRLLIEGDRKPRRGDLIYCRNASVGACALVETDVDFAMGQDVCLIRSTSENQRFLNYLLHSPFMDHQLELLLVGSTFKRINISEIKALAVLVPPRHEQDAICEFLDAGMVAYDTAISRVEREIELLREYRTRLVDDVVTGKLDVREVARRLPDEAPPEAAEDDTDLSDETESADQDAVA
jgi:type I restriction enzyme, S subunit